jgi:hypothetical protein
MRRTSSLLAAIVAASLLLAPGARATITVGSPLTGAFTPTKFNVVGLVATTALPESGAQVTSPISGTILRWRVTGASGGPLTLRVLRPVGGLTYTAVGSSAPVVPASSSTQVFPTSIPIQAGDVIGIQNTNKTDELGVMATAGAQFLGWQPPLSEGETREAKEAPTGIEPGFNADVQPRPTVTALGPASGSFLGGTAVAVSGTDFTDVSAVSFGGVPATSFTVSSAGLLTAVAPPAAAPGTVDVTVTTVAGTSPTSAADKFTYVACVVPNLKGMKLKAAKRKLRKARCAPGKIRLRGTATAKTGRVVKQSPKPRKTLAPGTKVNLTLG